MKLGVWRAPQVDIRGTAAHPSGPWLYVSVLEVSRRQISTTATHSFQSGALLWKHQLRAHKLMLPFNEVRKFSESKETERKNSEKGAGLYNINKKETVCSWQIHQKNKSTFMTEDRTRSTVTGIGMKSWKRVFQASVCLSSKYRSSNASIQRDLKKQMKTYEQGMRRMHWSQVWFFSNLHNNQQHAETITISAFKTFQVWGTSPSIFTIKEKTQWLSVLSEWWLVW